MSDITRPEDKAAALLKKLKLGDKLPIDVEQVAKKLGITVRYEHYDEDLSGVLVKEVDRVLIGVNSSHAVTRQRFTVAHECGHYVLQHTGEVFVDKTIRSQSQILRRDGKSSLGSDAYEVAANQFAAELLMPATILEVQVTKRLQAKSKISADELVSELASLFKVSSQAMEYRLTNLGYLMPN
jgi:Zn-dependent peptidase ImmA (M78 family)